MEWLQPYTDAKIRALGAGGVKALLAVPISFVSEHIETLEEIDMEYRELAMESGIQVGACLGCLLCVLDGDSWTLQGAVRSGVSYSCVLAVRPIQSSVRPTVL